MRSLLALLTLAAAPAMSASPDHHARPVFAQVERTATGIRVRVIGYSGRAMQVRFTLTLSSGGNAATQAGSVDLRPGRRVVLVDIHQSGGADAAGTLHVVAGTLEYAQPI